MHSLTVALGTVSWRLLFKTEESAQKNLKLLQGSGNDICAIFDDFGQSATLRTAAINGFLLEDMEQTKLAHVSLMLHEARTRAAATKQAQTDPALRMSTPMAGPGILTPAMGNGRMS